ncbi:MAG: YHS domain-containing (seleno)protein [Pseudomonadota bacterium]
MTSFSRRGFLTFAAAGAVALGLNIPDAEAKTNVQSGFAVAGYDPVAYFDGAPKRGSSEFTATHGGATYRFVSAANRDKFVANPARYAPQYGGYCAWAVAQGYTAKIDPTAYSVVNGKLYLNFNRSIRSRWENDIPGNIAAGDNNWPNL